MEEVSQVLDAFIGKIPIIVTPGKLLLDIATRFQGLGKQKSCILTTDKVTVTMRYCYIRY